MTEQTENMKSTFYILVLSLLKFSKAEEITWRYSNLHSETDIITVRDVIKLEVVLNGSISDDEVKWTVTEPCVVTSVTGTLTYMKCDSPGIYEVVLNIDTANKTAHSARLLEVVDTHSCYKWYLVFEHILHDENLSNETEVVQQHDQATYNYLAQKEKLILRVWIIDYLHGSEEERQRKAKFPSQNSKILSRQFYFMGQEPQVRFILKTSGRVEDRQAELKGYNDTYGAWEFHMQVLPSVRAQPSYVIQGHSVALYDCFVEDSIVLFPLAKFPNLPESPEYVLLGMTTVSLALLPDPCQGNMAAVIVHNKFYLTQDDFSSLKLLPAPPEYQRDVVVSSLTFMFNYLVVIIETKIYFLEREASQFKRYETPPDFVPTGVSSEDWCIEELFTTVGKGMLAMWDSQQVWISEDMGPASRLELPILLIRQLAPRENVTYEVHDVGLDAQPGRLGIALKLIIGSVNATNKVLFALHNRKLNTWTLAPFWVDFGTTQTGRISMFFLGLGKPAFYFRNQHTFHYSYDDGSRYGDKRVYGCNITKLAVRPDYIRDIIVSRKGDISVLLSTNQLLYGKIKIDEMVRFDAVHLPGNLNTMHWFDELNRLYFVTVHPDGTSEKLLYPLRNELMTVLGNEGKCPYRHFVYNFDRQVYMLDMREQIQFWAYLVHWQYERDAIDITVTDSDSLLEYNVKSTYAYSSGVASQNMTIQFIHNKNFYGIPDYEGAKIKHSGVAIMELRPIRVNLMCESPTNQVVYLSVGCPKHRRIQLRRETSEQNTETCLKDLKEYTIDKSLYVNYTNNQLPSEDKIVVYDEILGCPVVVEGIGRYKPEFDLYDRDNYLGGVTANYIMWEVHGRHDYGYTESMETVGCRARAQTWAEMRENPLNGTLPTINGSLLVEELWGPHNYVSCFLPNAEKPFTHEMHELPYELLNSSGQNSIQFNMDYDAIHVFKVKILDPNYSFCNLTTVFAVKVIGVVPPNDLMAIAIANYTVLTAIIMSLIATYVWFHRKSVKKIKPTLQEQAGSRWNSQLSLQAKTGGGLYS